CHHSWSAPDQRPRPHRRDEIQDQDPPADQRARSIDLPPRPRPPAAPRHLIAGAARPAITPSGHPSPPPPPLHPIRHPLPPPTPLSPNAADRGHPGSPSQPRDEQPRHIRKH